MAVEKRAAEYGIVRRVVPLEVELTTADVVIDSDELVVSQEVRQYDRDVGIAVGDTIVLVPAVNDELVAVAVVSETPLKSNAETASKAFVADAITAALAAAGAAAWSSGDLKPTARSSGAPTGWLLCDGSTVNRTTFASLFAAIGTAYNTGGEAGTDFRLPDMRGRAPIGAGTGTASDATAHSLGSYTGTETHALSIAEMPAHDHSPTGNGLTGSTTPGVTGGPSVASTGAGTSHTHTFTGTIHGHTPVGNVTYTGGAGIGTNSTGGGTADRIMAGNAGTGVSAVAQSAGSINDATAGGTNAGEAAHTHSLQAHTHTSAPHTHNLTAQGGGTASTIVQPSTTVNWLVKT